MKKKSEWIQRHGWVMFILITAIWIGYIFIMSIIYKSDINKAGTFGDMFGALNTLFTGLAFVGVVISLFQQNAALKQQQEALNTQKNELELYKNELKDNTEQLEEQTKFIGEQTKYIAEQSKNMQIQRFETTFFNLIDAHINIVNTINKEINYTGSQGSNIRLENKMIAYSTVSSNLKQIKKIREDHHKTKFKNWNLKDHLENIDNFVLAYNNYIFLLQYLEDSQMLSVSEKSNYADIYKAQLSRDLIELYRLYLGSKSEAGELDSQHHSALLARFNFIK